MNPFLNPAFLSKTLYGYIVETRRLNRMTKQQLSRYRDKTFRKLVNYAYSVPVYHKKYRETGIHPKDILGLSDITKLPFITKKDLRKNFPNGIIPPGFDKTKNFLISTSGSTGKPVSIYREYCVPGFTPPYSTTLASTPSTASSAES